MFLFVCIYVSECQVFQEVCKLEEGLRSLLYVCCPIWVLRNFFSTLENEEVLLKADCFKNYNFYHVDHYIIGFTLIFILLLICVCMCVCMFMHTMDCKWMSEKKLNQISPSMIQIPQR